MMTSTMSGRVRGWGLLLVSVLLCAACSEDPGTRSSAVTGPCNNGMKDNDETDTDCGGTSCGPCGFQQVCLIDADCAEGVCDRSCSGGICPPAPLVCHASTCNDGVANGDEVGVDCGGSCSQRCRTALCGGAPICVGAHVPLSEGDLHNRVGHPEWGDLAEVVSDRYEYTLADPAAEMVAMFVGYPASGRTVRVTISGPGLSTPFSVDTTAAPPSYGGSTLELEKLAFRVDLGRLEPGTFVVAASLVNGMTTEAAGQLSFSNQGRRAVAASFPVAGIDVVVPTQSHVPDGEWPITTGIPLPDGAIHDVARLQLLEDGIRVPAQLSVRSRWGSGGAIRWLGLDFTARWDSGTPRAYKLVRVAQAGSIAGNTSLALAQTASHFEITTGPARFWVNRTEFEGISGAWFDADADGEFETAEAVLGTGGGPFVNYAGDSSRYLARYACTDKPDEVAVEEGPASDGQRITIVARGWLCRSDGTAYDRYVTRMSFFAGSTQVRVKHRTIVAHATGGASPLLLDDVGFRVPVVHDPTNWRAGFDGTSFQAATPAAYDTVYLLQDRSEHALLNTSSEAGDVPAVGGAVSGAPGTIHRSDGWLTSTSSSLGAMVTLRDIYQRFPKELELTRANPAVGTPELVVHMWPRHGRDAFTSMEELDRAQIYKLRWAHEGSALDFRLPASYLAELEALGGAMAPEAYWYSGDAELIKAKGCAGTDCPMGASVSTRAQGVAITADFMLYLHPGSSSASALGAQAALTRMAPHALTTPAWNSATQVEEMLDAPGSFGAADDLLAQASPGYQRAMVDPGTGEADDEYGMWTYGGIHDNWDFGRDVPLLHRVWQQGHYRNIHYAWLDYFRTGAEASLRWARATTALFADAAVIHHDQEGGNGHDDHVAGGIKHCKGFMPWADFEDSAQSHWVDVSGLVFEYYLTGDGHAKDDFELWGSAASRKGTSGKQETSLCAGGLDLRNYYTTLGEWTRFYQAASTATARAQALLDIRGLADTSLPIRWECAGGNPLFDGLWFVRYFDQFRDRRVLERLVAWNKAGQNQPAANAFLWRETGVREYLLQALPEFYDRTHERFIASGSEEIPTRTGTFSERYDGYAGWGTASWAAWMREAPAFLYALGKSGTPLEPLTRRTGYPVGPTVNPYFAVYDSGGGYWSSAEVIALRSRPKRDDNKPTPPVAFRLEHVTSWSDPGPDWRYVFSGQGGRRTIDPMDIDREPSSSGNPAEGMRAYPYLALDRPGVDSPGASTVAVERTVDLAAPSYTTRELYSLECAGYGCKPWAPLQRSKDTWQPEAIVMRKSVWQSGMPNASPYRTEGRQDFFLRPVSATDTITLTLEAVEGRMPWVASPALVVIRDANGTIIFRRSMFKYSSASEDRAATITANPMTHPYPWHYYSSSEYGPSIWLSDGPTEVLARVRRNIVQEWDQGPVPTAASCDLCFIAKGLDSGVTCPGEGTCPNLP